MLILMHVKLDVIIDACKIKMVIFMALLLMHVFKTQVNIWVANTI